MPSHDYTIVYDRYDDETQFGKEISDLEAQGWVVLGIYWTYGGDTGGWSCWLRKPRKD